MVISSGYDFLNVYEIEVIELENYCARKYAQPNNSFSDIAFRARCAEIWAYEEAIRKCKEKFWVSPENILLDFSMYLSVAATKQLNYDSKLCFEKAYLVLEAMLNFLQKI